MFTDFSKPIFLVKTHDSLDHISFRNLSGVVSCFSALVLWIPWSLICLHQVCPKSGIPLVSKTIATDYIWINCSQSRNILMVTWVLHLQYLRWNYAGVSGHSPCICVYMRADCHTPVPVLFKISSIKRPPFQSCQAFMQKFQESYSWDYSSLHHIVELLKG